MLLPAAETVVVVRQLPLAKSATTRFRLQPPAAGLLHGGHRVAAAVQLPHPLLLLVPVLAAVEWLLRFSSGASR